MSPRYQTAKDIIPLSDFRRDAAGQLEKLAHSTRPLILTQNGRAAAVLLAPKDYDELVYIYELRSKITAGLRDLQQEASFDNASVEKETRELLRKK